MPFKNILRVYAAGVDKTDTRQATLNTQKRTKTNVAEINKKQTTVTNPGESKVIAIIAANVVI